MRELLIRYLLDELSAAERERVEAQLGKSGKLRRQLEHLRQCLECDDAPSETAADAPQGLAERTVEKVAGLSGEQPAPQSTPTASYLSAVLSDPPASFSRWSLADMVTATGVVMAVGMLLLPALRESRDEARRNVCQNNLRQVGALLVGYSEQNNHYLPHVGPDDNAGIFAVKLVDHGLINRKMLAELLVCPSSPLAERVGNGQTVVRIPAVVQLRRLQGPSLDEARRTMGGSYAYRIGYMKGNIYCRIRNQRDGFSPILADAPGTQTVGYKSQNHGGGGQNVLFQDLSVRYVVSCVVPEQHDHLYLNDDGLAAAGRHRRDAVLEPSEATPGVTTVSWRP